MEEVCGFGRDGFGGDFRFLIKVAAACCSFPFLSFSFFGFFYHCLEGSSRLRMGEMLARAGRGRSY